MAAEPLPDTEARRAAYAFGVVLAANSDDPESVDAMMQAVASGIADASAGVHPVVLGRDPLRRRTGFQLAALTAVTDSASRIRDALGEPHVERCRSGACLPDES